MSNCMLSILQQKAHHNNISLENVTLCRMNALEIPLENESIDTVVANSVLHLISNPEKVVAEILRVFKKDSTFICKDDMPRKVKTTKFDNTKYNEIINLIYSRYWEDLSAFRVMPKKYSWKFDRSSCCNTLFESKHEINIEYGNIYKIPLKNGFLARFLERGFSDQIDVQQDLHKKVIAPILDECSHIFGNNYADISFKGIEEDLLITVYRK